MRTQATLLSFFLVFGAYLLYGWVLVPLVLPSVERAGGSNGEGPLPPTPPPPKDEIAHYLELLPEDGWERSPDTAIRWLRFGQVMVFFNEDEIDPNDRRILRLKPCTILMLPDDFKEYRDDEETKEKIRQSVVFRTQQSAEIVFDADLDFSKMSFPNLVAGRLLGKVTVKSSMKDASEQDDFSLETEHVEVREEADSMTISTLRKVRFKFGLHSGEGTGLTLTLAQADPLQPQTNKELQSLNINTLESLRLVFPEKNSDITTIDVRCQNRFVFAANPAENGWTASFFQNVDMVRTNPDKTADRLTADTVHLTLTAPKQEGVNKNKASQFDSLEPALFVARGKPGQGTQPPVPARLSVKQGGDVTLVGDEIFLDLRQNYLQLATRNESGASPFVEMIVDNQYTIRSERSVRYTFGQDREFGRLIADGKGNLTGKIGEGIAAKDIRLDWNEMQMAPHPTEKDQIVLKLENGIAANMTGFGKMTAQQLELYCVNASSGAGGQKNSLMLDRITVRNNVLFETESGTCRVNQLHIFFVNVAADGREIRSSWMPPTLARTPPIPPGRTARVQQPIQQVQHLQPLTPQNPIAQNPAAQSQAQPIPLYSPSAPMVAAPAMRTTAPQRTAPRGSVESQNLMGIKSSPGGGTFDITGDQMRMQVRIQNGFSSAEVIEIDGNVRLKENVAGSVPNTAIEIVGDTVTIWNPGDSATSIQITGRAAGNDAIFKGRGVELRAKELKLSREDNMFWSPGPGQLMAHTAQISAPGVPASNSNDDKLFVEWNKEMRCDGRVLQFIGLPDTIRDRVKVVYQRINLWCNQMELHLNRQVMFFDDSSNVPPEPVKILCAGKVYVTNQQLDIHGRIKSQDFAQVENLHYDVKRNYFFAEGPGELSSIFLAGTPGNLAGTPVSSTREELQQLGVRFPDAMQGILLGDKKKVEFSGRKVEVVYCPAANLEDRVGWGNLSAARLRGYTLECELLTIEEMPNPVNLSQSFFELTASNPAIIEGSGIFGRARTIRYNEAKSVVDMSGDVTVHKTTPGQTARAGPAEQIVYNIATGEFEVIQMQRGIGIH